MLPLRELLKEKYPTNSTGYSSIEQVANEVTDLLFADPNNFYDVTGFAKDFYLITISEDDKQYFYNMLKNRGFFQQLSTFLYSENFSYCSWAIYITGKFSNHENAGYLETAYETNFVLTNPMLAYRCLSELDWLHSKKVDQYLANLRADNSIISKLILLYYWQIKSYSPEYAQLIADKELLDFITPKQLPEIIKDNIFIRLFSFENDIAGQYSSLEKASIDKQKFQNIAETFFKNYKE